MSSDNDIHQGEATRAIHAGQEPDPAFGALASPIYQTTAFAYDSIDQAVARAAHLEEGYSYSRVANPTLDALERKLAALEGAEACVTFGSGMGAISALFLGMCGAGDHVVCADSIYGATQGMLTTTFCRWGLQVTFVDAREPSNIARAIGPDTRLVYLESPSNPTLRLVDFEAVAQLAHDRQVPVATDNTFATSVNQRPLEFGVDLVVYSATKYICGHGDTLGGAVLGRNDLLRRIRTEEDPGRRDLESIQRLSIAAWRADAAAARGTAQCQRRGAGALVASAPTGAAIVLPRSGEPSAACAGARANAWLWRCGQFRGTGRSDGPTPDRCMPALDNRFQSR